MQSWLGVGVDLIRVERVAKISEGARMRLFTVAELANSALHPARQAEKLAGRFAAKEAVLKALGTGLAAGIRWHDVEITNGSAGEPLVLLHGRALELAAEKGVHKVLLSISHDGGMAIAFAALV